MRCVVLALCAAVALSTVSAQEMGGAAPVDFETQILPLLRRSCFECHSDAKPKPKGGLRLDGRSWILSGGKTGAAVVPGEPGKSPLLERASLPEDHDDVMPPNGEVLTTEQLQLVARWIEEGAEFGKWTGKSGVDARQPIEEAQATDPFEAYRRIGEGLAAAPATAIAKATEAGARVAPVFPGSPLLRVEFISRSEDIDDATIKVLAALRRNVAILGLRGAAITDASMTEIGRMQNLVRLDIPETGVTDAGLRTLAKTKLPELAVLNLYGTAITDAGLDQLNYQKLAKVYIWETKVTAAGADMLAKRLPDCRVVWKRGLPAGETPSADGKQAGKRRKKKQ